MAYRLTLLICLIFMCFISAQETAKITRSYTVSVTDLPQVKAAVEAAISSQGKVIVVEKAGKLIVQDVPTQFGVIDEIVQAFNAPQPNVRIEIISKTFGNDSQRQLEISGRTRVGDVTIGNRRRSGMDVGFDNSNGTTDSLNSQFLVVRSGGSASIEVGQDIPAVDYFWTYARGLGLITNIQTRWEKIGSQLAIRPKVFGNQIQVDVIPQIRKLSNDFFENESVISFQNLQTSVTVMDGSTIEIGGIAQADSNFQQHFFGFQRGQTSENTSITLKASILR